MYSRIFLAAALTFACWAHAIAAEPPVIKMDVALMPVQTSRVFQTGFGPKPGGGWNFICQCMNYKYTTGRKKVTIEMDNGAHYLAYADTKSRPDAEWVIVDLEAGAYKVVNLPGFHSAAISGGGCLAGNGRVFFGVDYGHVYYYEPAEETIKILGRVQDSIRVLRQFYKLELGPDGMVYGASQSTNGVACVIRINPDTLEWNLINDVGVPGRRKLTYGYYIGIEPPWLYVAVGQGKWELWAVNFDTGEKKMLAERIGKKARVTVLQGKDCCAAELIGEPERLNVVLRDGAIVVQVKHGERLTYTARAKQYKTVEWKMTQPMNVDAPPELDRKRRPAVGGQGEATVYWRPAGAKEWKETRFAVKNVEPVKIESLTLLPDGSVLGSTAQYHGWFRYYPDKESHEYFGKGGPSGAKIAVVGGKVYFAGYPNTSLSVYDPAKPWTNSKTGRAGAPQLTNPTHLGYQGQGRSEAHHAITMAQAKGRVYTQGLRERWATGTGLCCYNIATKQFTALGQENKDLKPVHMIAMPQMERIIVSGAKKDAKLLVYDLDLKAVGEIELRPGQGNTGYMLPVSDTRFLGWYVDPAAKNTVLYLYDLAAGTMLKSVRIKGEAVWAVERPVDRTFWLLSKEGLQRLDPETLALALVGKPEPSPSVPSLGGSSVHKGRPFWRGKELYGVAHGSVIRSGPIE